MTGWGSQGDQRTVFDYFRWVLDDLLGTYKMRKEYYRTHIRHRVFFSTVIMSVHLFLDDLMVTSNSPIDLMAFYASLAAITDLEIEAELGESLTFLPVNPSPFIFSEFMNRFNFHMQRLSAAAQSDTASQ